MRRKATIDLSTVRDFHKEYLTRAQLTVLKRMYEGWVLWHPPALYAKQAFLRTSVGVPYREHVVTMSTIRILFQHDFIEEGLPDTPRAVGQDVYFQLADKGKRAIGVPS